MRGRRRGRGGGGAGREGTKVLIDSSGGAGLLAAAAKALSANYFQPPRVC